VKGSSHGDVLSRRALFGASGAVARGRPAEWQDAGKPVRHDARRLQLDIQLVSEVVPCVASAVRDTSTRPLLFPFSLCVTYSKQTSRNFPR
jgi:hypothetical protein